MHLSYSMTNADEGMTSIGSKSVSSLTINPYLTGLPEGAVRVPSYNTTICKPPKTECGCPDKRSDSQ